MEPSWEEALDVDDSDLHSPALLRPCKQRRRVETNPTTTTTTVCTVQSQTLDSSHSSSQTVKSLTPNSTSVNQTESTPLFRTIPGPAGIVQAALLRKALDSENFLGQEEHPMATQDYIRRAVENPEEDEDFKHSPWLSAIEFVYADGMFNSVPNAPLGEIKKYLKNGKLDQVVAVIKSCAPNELGDLMVTLKDPTGTISGTIHHKVITEGEFGKRIFVGSVLILHKVSVFSPSRSAHYLNITKRNLVKVFNKDSGSLQKQTFHGCRIIDAASGSDSRKQTTMLSDEFSLERVEGLVNGITRSANCKQSLHVNDEQENVNPIEPIAQQCSMTSHEGAKQKITRGKEIIKEADVIKSIENEHSASENIRQPTQRESLSGSLECASNFVIDGNKNGLKAIDTVQVHAEPASASASLPVWTDEQLNELFDDDFQDHI